MQTAINSEVRYLQQLHSRVPRYAPLYHVVPGEAVATPIYLFAPHLLKLHFSQILKTVVLYIGNIAKSITVKLIGERHR